MKNKKLLVNSLLTILIFITGFVQAQEQKVIKGTITYQDQPLSNVHIVNLESKQFVKSDTKGNYEITAKVGAELSFSYVGLKTVTILIEDVTSELNIKMSDQVNQLDDVIVKGKGKRDGPQYQLENEDIDIITPMGVINPKKSGFAITRIDGEKLPSLPGNMLVQVLSGKTAGVERRGQVLYIRNRPAQYIVDDGAVGFISLDNLDLGLIKDIYIIKNQALVAIYTVNHPRYVENEKKKIEEKYKNQNFYDTNSVTADIDATQNDLPLNLGEEREIFGTLTFLNKPVADVLVSVAGKKDVKVYSDRDGKYRLKVQVGDIVQYTHASYETVSIFVEDVTEELSFSLKDQIRELGEVVVTMSKNRGAVANQKEKMQEDYDTTRGDFDPTKSGYSQTYVDGSKISNVYPNIQEALVGKITSYIYDRTNGNSYLRNGSGSLNEDSPVAWEIDGVFTTYAPPVELSQIKSVRALKSYGATNRYGSQAKGGVIVIKTIFGDFTPDGPKKNSFLEEYANSNFYSGDASLASLEMKEQNKYAQSVAAYKNKYKAFEFYQNELKDKITNYGDHLSVAIQFLEKYDDETLATKIFEEVAVANGRNPEVLKSIAYYYQLLGNQRGAIAMYERVFKLRPKHAQSFRDLSNAYVDYDMYRKAWKLYWAYMIKGKVTSEEGIGELMYNDMEWLFYRRANQMKFKRNFVPIHKNETDFKRDVRMVFEWNTSEAEFELEFVSPDRRVYTFDHSLEANSDLITQEKKLGYSSKMFVIEDLGKGDWLVNITYKGNKKTVPTFLKLTTYFNWGKPSEKRDVNVYKLDIQNQKASLLKFDSEFEVFDKIAKN